MGIRRIAKLDVGTTKLRPTAKAHQLDQWLLEDKPVDFFFGSGEIATVHSDQPLRRSSFLNSSWIAKDDAQKTPNTAITG